jgi:hypothetical protein
MPSGLVFFEAPKRSTTRTQLATGICGRDGKVLQGPIQNAYQNKTFVFDRTQLNHHIVVFIASPFGSTILGLVIHLGALQGVDKSLSTATANKFNIFLGFI